MVSLGHFRNNNNLRKSLSVVDQLHAYFAFFQFLLLLQRSIGMLSSPSSIVVEDSTQY